MTDAPAILATRLADAYRSKSQIVPAELVPPKDLMEAALVHLALAKNLGAETGGWKVGVRPDGQGLGAPLFANTIVANGATHPIHPAGATGIEIEIALRLGHDLPPSDRDYTRADILDATESVLIGIELVESRIKDFKSAAYELFVADLMANCGYVIGDEASNWRHLDLGALPCTLEINGETTHDVVGGHPQNDPLLPVIAFANRKDQPLGGMKRGQIITTGALCGLIFLGRPSAIKAKIGSIGSVEMHLA